MQDSILDQARGRWRGILPALGISERFLNGKHQPCPLCGGIDRARFDDKEGNGTYFCNQCGAGNGMQLVMKFKSLTWNEAMDVVRPLIGVAPYKKPVLKITDQAKRAAMNELWKRAKPIQSGDPADLYLTSRGIKARPACLRYAADVRYSSTVATYHPCMITMVKAPDGKATILHRTYLTNDGKKANVEIPKKNMPGTIALGSAVRLAEYGEEIGIAEGIETALSAMAIFNIPCWAALHEIGMRNWVAPKNIKSVVIFGDSDANYVGQAAAYHLAKRLSIGDGRKEKVRVEIPSGIDTDWNDALLQMARYDANADLAGSIKLGFDTIRSRMANGGEGWTPS